MPNIMAEIFFAGIGAGGDHADSPVWLRQIIIGGESELTFTEAKKKFVGDWK